MPTSLEQLTLAPARSAARVAGGIAARTLWWAQVGDPLLTRWLMEIPVTNVAGISCSRQTNASLIRRDRWQLVKPHCVARI